MKNLDKLVPEWRALRTAARLARDQAYAPYSKYHVGAALLSNDDRVFSGCNVENASYGLTICAERVALSAAVAMGQREFRTICISLTGNAVPCGACRQVLHEFAPKLVILLDNLSDDPDADPEVVRLSDLLPRAFDLDRS